MGKIASIEYFRVPPRWVFVKIVDEAGNFGWGEASLEGHTQAVEGCLDAWIERYVGFEADDIEHIWQMSWRTSFYRGGPVFMSALAGIDIALWDLKARKLGVPIYQLLGGKVRDKLKVYAWIGGDRPSDVKSQALARKDQGFNCVKMNGTEDLGWLDSPSAMYDCVERLKTVKEAGMDAGIDFHGRVHKPMAKQLAAALQPHHPLFIEEPLLSEHIGGLKALSQQTSIPIALGERLHSRWDVRPFLESGCVDILQPDISHCGGISEMKRIAAMCEAYDVALAPHCPLGPIALAACVQVDATSANFAIQEMSLGIHYNVGGQDLTSYIHNPEVWVVKEGYIDLTKEPGLGIEVNEAMVRELSKGAKAWVSPGFIGPGTFRKKTRCTGRCPCTLCLRTGLPCEFTASYTRGRLPLSMPTQGSALDTSMTSSPNTSLQLPVPNTVLDRPNTTEPFIKVDRLTVPDDPNRDPPSRSSPEPAQTDQQGHYVGPASGVSFLLRIQRRLHQNSSLSHESSIFTFGDAPLPEFDPTFFVLPPKADAQRLVERYFDFASPTHRFLHRPSIEKMLQEFYETMGDMRNKEDAPAKTALLLIIFAQAQAYMPPGSKTGSTDTSARYFFAADHQLSKERGAIRLASVQARLGQCFYLLTQSRINHCWSLFGTMAHLALAIGLHRGRRCEPSGTLDYIELESRRRLFWCAYTLDKYLAAALGRPRTFKDEDIDQELPTIVNDNDLHATSINPSPSKTQSVMMAPVEHVKISRIVSLILRDLYPIRPPSMPLRIELATKYSKDLREWRANLTRFLDADGVDTSLLIPLYQRQRNVLNLAYHHAILLVQRPFLLSNFASLAYYDHRPGSMNNIDTTQNIAECLEAAMAMVRIVDELFQGNQIFRAFWFTQYYAFCAVVVIYIYRIQQHFVEPGKCEGYFAAGQRCQAQLSSISETDCLSKRYCLVLEELRLEATRQTNQQNRPALAGSPAAQSDQLSLPTVSAGMPISSSTPKSDASAGFAATFSYGGNIPPTPESAVFNMIPTSSIMADLTSWGQFDSLVTAGIGVLDGSFPGDSGFGFGSSAR
ncbi:uncharacterized protein BDR25DRAFT_330733 [Lindgomyces ingoldianus]|uniref:Uncharacterized protein n=1 Tax=Lindgomyces ingoldianus TaxID=673940 RepID=A0ACB6RFS7_9PLEO|nr:uncharacterized protein BDR25DRAFT_330733 [Lindgomyces ingoldianus]KAF2478204.1 hypothetical protein BDR25DRAFT_330733 [Lindgomyces ingoldianus]